MKAFRYFVLWLIAAHSAITASEANQERVSFLEKLKDSLRRGDITEIRNSLHRFVSSKSIAIDDATVGPALVRTIQENPTAEFQKLFLLALRQNQIKLTPKVVVELSSLVTHASSNIEQVEAAKIILARFPQSPTAIDAMNVYLAEGVPLAAINRLQDLARKGAIWSGCTGRGSKPSFKAIQTTVARSSTRSLAPAHFVRPSKVGCFLSFPQ